MHTVMSRHNHRPRPLPVPHRQRTTTRRGTRAPSDGSSSLCQRLPSQQHAAPARHPLRRVAQRPQHAADPLELPVAHHPLDMERPAPQHPGHPHARHHPASPLAGGCVAVRPSPSSSGWSSASSCPSTCSESPEPSAWPSPPASRPSRLGLPQPRAQGHRAHPRLTWPTWATLSSTPARPVPLSSGRRRRHGPAHRRRPPARGPARPPAHGQGGAGHRREVIPGRVPVCAVPGGAPVPACVSVTVPLLIAAGRVPDVRGQARSRIGGKWIGRFRLV